MAVEYTRKNYTVEDRIRRAAQRRAWYYPPWKPLNWFYYDWLIFWNSRGDMDKVRLHVREQGKSDAVVDIYAPELERLYQKALAIESRLLKAKLSEKNRHGPEVSMSAFKLRPPEP